MLALVVALLLLAALPAAAQTPCVVPAGPVTLPLQCAPGNYTSPGVTFTPVVIPPDPIPGDDPYRDIPAGTWARRGGLISTVFPNPQPPGGSAGVFAYSGAVRAGQQLCILGGGHQDSGDNSVYCHDTMTLTWTRAWGPSPLNTIPAKGGACSTARKYADGSPSARHTYHGIHWLGGSRILLLGGSMWCGAGDGANDAWELDLTTKVWTERPAPPFYLPLGAKGGVLADGTAYVNADTSNNQLYRRLPSGVWQAIGGPPAPTGYASAIDPKRGLLVYLTSLQAGATIGISTQRLDNGALTARTLTGDRLPSTSTAVLGSLDYDDSSDRIIVWAGTPTPYAVNLDDNSVAQLPGLGTPPGAPSTAGTWGRWRCLPGRGVCVLLRSATEEPFIYRVARAGPVPPQPPTTYTMTVAQTGTGHGTVSGAGSYAAGATVPLSATPDATSTFDGWVETPCRTSPYLMPAANATCTASFTQKPAPPNGGPISLVPGAFVRILPPSFRGPSSGSKHVTFVPRPGTPLVYGMGGDFQDTATSAPDSYRQELYTYSLTAALAGDAERGWRRIQDYCQGGVQPKSPDYQGWVWDALRGGFWSVPGTSFIPGQAVCPGRTVAQQDDPLFKYRHLMLYKPDVADPTQRWTDWDAAYDPTQQYAQWQSIHDATDDKLVGFIHHGGNGGGIRVYSPATKTMRYKWLESSATGNLRLENSLPCHDVQGRVAYYGDPYSNRFYRFDIATETLTRLADVPPPSMSDVDPYVLNAWRPSAKECWLWNKKDRSLWVFSASSGTWRQEVYTQSPAAPPEVNVTNAITWDPTNDVLLFLGTNAPGAGTGVWAYKPR